MTSITEEILDLPRQKNFLSLPREINARQKWRNQDKLAKNQDLS